MVSNASDDLPEPDTPVMTVNWLCGSDSEMSLRLWTRAPRIRMKSCTWLQPGGASFSIATWLRRARAVTTPEEPPGPAFVPPCRAKSSESARYPGQYRASLIARHVHKHRQA